MLKVEFNENHQPFPNSEQDWEYFLGFCECYRLLSPQEKTLIYLQEVDKIDSFSRITDLLSMQRKEVFLLCAAVHIKWPKILQMYYFLENRVKLPQ